jgi:hypothetical protein
VTATASSCAPRVQAIPTLLSALSHWSHLALKSPVSKTAVLIGILSMTLSNNVKSSLFPGGIYIEATRKRWLAMNVSIQMASSSSLSRSPIHSVDPLADQDGYTSSIVFLPVFPISRPLDMSSVDTLPHVIGIRSPCQTQSMGME